MACKRFFIRHRKNAERLRCENVPELCALSMSRTINSVQVRQFCAKCRMTRCKTVGMRGDIRKRQQMARGSEDTLPPPSPGHSSLPLSALVQRQSHDDGDDDDMNDNDDDNNDDDDDGPGASVGTSVGKESAAASSREIAQDLRISYSHSQRRSAQTNTNRDNAAEATTATATAAATAAAAIANNQFADMLQQYIQQVFSLPNTSIGPR